MNIKEYYDGYKVFGKYPFTVKDGRAETLSEFYNDCIFPHCLPAKTVLDWHEMLMRYVDRPDAIYWIRYYEGGNKKSGRWNNRRASATTFQDGFSYIFVSNFDVQELLNMMRLGVTPSDDEFAEMMRNRTFRLHYDPGKSCEEADICCFERIGGLRGILGTGHWYLAHMHGIKTAYLRRDGSETAVSKAEAERIFPRGKISDWKVDPLTGKKLRRLEYSLTDEEKEIVKAHFLRFVDPLNYYVVPNGNFERNDVCKAIGEYAPLNEYMERCFRVLYGDDTVREYLRKALIKERKLTVTGKEKVNVAYGPSVCGTKKPSAPASSQKRTTTHDNRSEVLGLFDALIEGGKITSSVEAQLADNAFTKKTFGISSFSFLIKQDEMVDSLKQRYYARSVIVNGTAYRVVSQWKPENLAKLHDWAKTL